MLKADFPHSYEWQRPLLWGMKQLKINQRQTFETDKPQLFDPNMQYL